MARIAGQVFVGAPHSSLHLGRMSSPYHSTSLALVLLLGAGVRFLHRVTVR